ncbi:amidohydrolase family protein [Deinococcus sp.]|uniref:amidohydrolase family protein n=1 Tax=Deinococcus sp. TaxID=47478 RepID=UPI003CC50432
MTEPVAETVLKNVRLWSASEAAPTDLIIRDGLISGIGPTELPGEDLGGRLLMPGFVEPHVHLDKTLSLGADGLENESGTLGEAIERWHLSEPLRDRADFERRADAALSLALSRGVTSLRTHINVSSLSPVALEAALAVRERWRNRMTVQIVALGLPGSPAEDAAYAEALRLGVDVIGGSPNHAPDPAAAIRSAFRLAEQFDRPIDLHIDENEDPASRYLESIAELTLASGLGSRVSADHCCSLAYMDAAEQARIIGKVASSGMNIVSLPAVNLLLQGKGQPSARGVVPIRALLAAGVNVALGSDNVRDPFNPLGHYDPLWQANLAVHAALLARPPERQAALEMITGRSAQVFGLPQYGLHVGHPADLLLLDAHSAAEALSEIAPRLRVYKAGRVVFRQEISRTWT